LPFKGGKMEGEPQGLLLRRRHVLDWLGISEKTFEKWTRCEIVHPVYIGGGKPFYLKKDVEKLVEEASDGRKGVNQEN